MSEENTAPRKVGRPSSFTQEIADAICYRLIEGESLRSICRDDGMPGFSTVFDWLDIHDDFRSKYARAREIQADSEVDEIKEISDGANVENWQVAKVRIETRKWRAEKLKPKKYGTQNRVELTGLDGGPIEHRSADTITDAELEAIARTGRPARTEPEAGEN